MKNLVKDYSIFIFISCFLIISYLSIYESSIYLNEKLYYKQLIWYTIGFFLIWIIRKINIDKLLKYSIYLYSLNVILLFGLFFIGSEINNSKAWYTLFGICIQPSEFMKISIILLDSYIINKYYKRKNFISTKKELELIIKLLIIFFIPSILTFLEPDTGAVIGYLVITISMIYFSNINKNWIKGIIVICTISLILFLFMYFNYQNLFIDIFGSNFFYRIDRLINWNSRSGMQLNNSLIAIGSSGFLGHKSIPLYYPELETDFIFTSFSSVYGIVGGLLLIILAFSFDIYILNMIKKTSHKKYKRILFTIAMLFLYQHIQSIGMTLGLVPIIGVTLPLVSYGGSSLISYLIITGIIINIKEKA